ncbi:hypothetical protein Pan216_08020 [Planctomycetes bacterium Pan216]|uniref:Subtilase-type serine protease n=1 Tax=Kolteria novifilia TaxID=2527975 RepID=A0A518AZ15_9BACT|nr:hypothetical protein Pan216_08020 [Planctomycetes bacterium Pan216]
MTRSFLPQCVVALLTLVAGPLAPTWAQLPNTQLQSVRPAGGKIGEKVTVSITGKDLDDVASLRFSHPGIVASQATRAPKKGETGPQVVANQFEIAIAPDVPTGIYEVRAIGRFGTSPPRSFLVSPHTQELEKEGNDDIASAMPLARDVVMNGRSDRGGDVDFYRISAGKGERLFIECVAEQIDSQLDPILSIHDADGRLLHECRDTFRHDAFLDFTAPKEGDYWVKVSDIVYDGNVEHFYQLRVHQDPHLDFVFPPAATPGTKAKMRLYGRNLPGGTPSGIKINGREIEQLDVTIDIPKRPAADGRIDADQFKRLGILVSPPNDATDGFAYRLPLKFNVSNPVFIGFATEPVVAENEPNNDAAKAQPIKIPSEVAGRFAPAGDRDWYSFEAKKGEVIELDVISQRTGIATDPFLVVQQMLPDGKVKDLAEVDNLWDANTVRRLNQETRNFGGFAFNTQTDDAVHELKVPADGTYRVMVRDLYYTARNEGGAVYRLAVRKPRPNFRLVALSHYPEDLFPMNRKRYQWVPLLRRGGTEEIDVLVYRWDGFDGDVELSLEGLPEGVTCSKAVCRKGEMSAPIILTASKEAKKWDGPIRVVGRALVDGKKVEKEADYGTVIWFGQNTHWGCRARYTPELLLSVREEDSPLRVDLGEGTVWKVAPGEKIKIPAKLVRQGKFDGAVQLLASAMPPNMSSKVVTIGKGKDSAEVEVTVGKNALLGTHHFFFEAKADTPYEKNPVLEDDDKAKKKKKTKPVSVRTPTTMVTLVVEKPEPKEAAKKK